MFKKILLSIVVLCSLMACSSTYKDSAAAEDGGRFVVGSFEGKRAVFYCPASSDGGKCQRIKVKMVR